MAKERRVNTKLWSDSWIRSINPLDRYLFIYFLTNEHTDLCGIYELPLDTLAHETGLKENDLRSSYLPRLKPKIYYHENWVIIPNFPKHQNTESPKIIEGIKRSLSVIPVKILKKAIGYGYPMDTISHLDLDLDSNLDLIPEQEVPATPSLKAKRVLSSKEYSFEETMKAWKNGKPEQKIFVDFLTFKKMKFLSEAEQKQFVKNYFSQATILKRYSPQRLQRVFAHQNEESKQGEKYEWTLRTVANIISNKKYE